MQTGGYRRRDRRGRGMRGTLAPAQVPVSRTRSEIFDDYRIRVAAVVRDYGMFERDEAPQQAPERTGSTPR